MTSPEVSLCQVWVADLAMQRPGHRSLLNSEEQKHRQSLRRPVDRARFTLGAALTRLVAGTASGEPADRVQILRRCPRCGGAHGKPQLPGHRLHHSVSHAGDLVLVAMTDAGPVGVDVEPIDSGNLGLPTDLILHPTESLSAPGDLLTYWCRKESVVKADGRGMFAPFSEIHVGRADRPPVLSDPDGQRQGVQMFDLEPRPGYLGAITVLTTTPITISMIDAAPLLRTTPAPTHGPTPTNR